MPECYIRGSTIKYLRIPDEIIDMVKEEVVSKGRGRGGPQQNKQQGKGGRGGGASRGEWKHSLFVCACGPNRSICMSVFGCFQIHLADAFTQSHLQ